MAAERDTEADTSHPRHTAALFGHKDPEQALLKAWDSGRMPHAWMLTGPPGIGKATLAYRFARYILSQPDPDAGSGLFGDDLATASEGEGDSLAIAADDPVFQRIAAGAHGNLTIIERTADPKTGKMRGNILVDQIRKLQRFFTQTASEGGWRVAIIDSADEMNRSAANALLKTLEEPPDRSVLLLVASRPGLLPPTIRSRCRVLEMRELATSDVAAFLADRLPEANPSELEQVAALSEGSPGRALTLADGDGIALYRRMLGLLGALPRPASKSVHSLADDLGPARAAAQYVLFTQLLRDWLGRFVRASAGGTSLAVIDASESEIANKLRAAAGLDRWIEVWEKVGEIIERAEALNLDRKQVILKIVRQLESAAAT